MKIGILTFHSQLNYGGVLQCWALQTVLEQLGYEAVVIDRWHNTDNSLLEHGYNKWGWQRWIKFWIRSLLGLGDINHWLRVRRTKSFLKKHLRLTPYHFVDWKDAPENLGVDLLVIGSDQVWHCGDWGDPQVYLLDGAPNIPAISYAASFGFTELPKCLNEREDGLPAEPLYREGLKKFRALSCRESEGVYLCRALGVEAQHVLDPTLLVDKTDWERVIGTVAKHCKKRIVCYLLGIDYKTILSQFVQFSGETDCKVDIFVDQWIFDALPVPTSSVKLRQWAKGLNRKMFGNVRIYDSAGPIEFVRAIANADLVVSDSFHALMFSIVFGRNVRILEPKSDHRKKMFARIEEFATHVKGPVIVDSVSAALASFANGEKVSFDYDWLSTRRKESQSWLASVTTHPLTHS